MFRGVPAMLMLKDVGVIHCELQSSESERLGPLDAYSTPDPDAFSSSRLGMSIHSTLKDSMTFCVDSTQVLLTNLFCFSVVLVRSPFQSGSACEC